MRTTITFDAEVLAAVEAWMHEHALGRSEAVNELIRRGLGAPVVARGYVHESHDLGAMIDVSNVAEALELTEEWDRRSGARPSSEAPGAG